MKPSSLLQLQKLRASVSITPCFKLFFSALLADFIIVIDNNPYINFTIKDFPGNQELKENSAADVATIKACGSLIFVIDAQQQEYEMSCNRLCDLIKTCSSINKNILFEVFIHKVDTDMFLCEDQKMSCLNDIQGIMK